MATCNDCLPLDTIIKSTVELEDITEIVGNDCLMILTNEANCGPDLTASPVNATDLSVTYSSIDDAANDWDASCTVYDSILAAFSQTPRVAQVKVGYYDPADVGSLDTLFECSGCKAIVTPELRDDPAQVAIAAWAEANEVFYFPDVCDPINIDPADTASIGYQLTQAGYEFTEYWYHNDCTVQAATALASYSIGHNFAEAGQNYSQVFADIVGVPPVPMTTTQLEALTGFSSATGIDTNAAHHGNTVVCIDGCVGVTPIWGLSASGDFFDNLHYKCSLNDRIKAAQCAALTNGPITATVSGYQVLANGVRNILRTDQLNGYVAGDIGNEDSDGLGYQVTIPTPAQAGAALRGNRIAPCVTYSVRRDQPVHVACNQGLITL